MTFGSLFLMISNLMHMYTNLTLAIKVRTTARSRLFKKPKSGRFGSRVMSRPVMYLSCTNTDFSLHNFVSVYSYFCQNSTVSDLYNDVYSFYGRFLWTFVFMQWLEIRDRTPSKSTKKLAVDP
jgi:hypothetical protein